MAGKQTLVQRIALDGGDEIKRELLSLGKAGEAAFNALQRQARASAASSTGLNAQLVKVRASIVALGGAAQGVARQFSFLGGAVGQFGAVLATAFSADALINATSVWTDLKSRIQLAVGAGEDADAVLARIAATAKGTYTSLEATATQFADNSFVLNALGFSTQKQLDLQEAFNNTMVVSGARAERLEQVQRSFSNALALGALRGEDFNNFQKAGGRLMELLAEKLGVGVDALKGLAAEGKITRDVLVNTLLEAQKQVAEEAAAMPATIRDAFTNLNSSFIQYIGTADQASGTSAALASAIQWVGENLDTLIPAVVGLVAALLAVKAVGIAAALFQFGTVLVSTVIPAVLAFTAALLTNPLVLIAAVVAGLILVLIQATGGFENFGKVVGTVAGVVFDALSALVQPVLDFLTAVGGAITAFATWIGLIKGDSSEGADAVSEVQDVVDQTNDALGDTSKAGKTAGTDVSKGFNTASTSVDHASQAVDGLTNSLGSALAQAQALVEEMGKLGGGGGGGGGNSQFSLDTPAYAGGGSVRGAGSGTSDSILARLSNGEFVMRAKAVRKWGVGFLNRLNRGLPAFASGGLVTAVPSFTSVPAFAGGAANGAPSGRPFTLVLDGKAFSGLSAPDEVASGLVAFAASRKVRSAGRKPGWYGK